VSAKKSEEVFEKKAKKILDYLRSPQRYDQIQFPRPFFIEFTGSPDAGKTTTIRELYTFLRRFGLHVGIPQEGAEVIQHIPRTTPEYNIRTGIYALSILLDESWRHNHDVIILDRGIYDAYVWMNYWQEKGKLTVEQKSYYQNFFLAPFWKDRVDISYFVTCEAEVAMERALKISATSRLGQSTNPVSVTASVERYRNAFEELSVANPQLRLVDTTTLPAEQMIERFTAEILDILVTKTGSVSKKGPRA